MTRLVLTNAIYFKSEWAVSFRKEATQQAPFHLSTKEQVEVPLMHQRQRFRYRGERWCEGVGIDLS